MHLTQELSNTLYKPVAVSFSYLFWVVHQSNDIGYIPNSRPALLTWDKDTSAASSPFQRIQVPRTPCSKYSHWCHLLPSLWQFTISKQWLSYLQSCLKNSGMQMLTDPSGQLHVPRATHPTVWHGQRHLPTFFGDPHQKLLDLFKITTVAWQF